MANTTRDSFSDTAGYTEVTFQRGEDVLDSELNELQKIQRSDRVKQLTTLQGSYHCHSNDNGGRVTADGVASNTLTIKAGTLVAAGYVVQFAADVVKTGLATPGADSVTDVWLLVFESEISSATDPNIAVTKLGETTVRQKVTATLSYAVATGFNTASTISSVANSDATPPYLGGAGKYVHLARVYRANGVAVITQATIVDMRGRSLGAEAAQDRNVMVRGSAISWNGTTLSFGTIVVRVPGETGFFNGATLSVAPADGNAVGWLATTEGNRFRRRFDGLTTDNGAISDGNTDNLLTLVAFNALPVADSQFAHNMFVLAVRDGTQIILRDGTVMNSGDYLHAWGQQGGVQATAEADVNPLLQFRSSNGKMRTLIDHSGYRMGQVTEIDENWRRGSTQFRRVALASASHDSAPASYSSGVDTTGGQGIVLRSAASGEPFSWDFNWLRVGMTVTAVNAVLTRASGTSNFTFQVIDTSGFGVQTSVGTGTSNSGTGNSTLAVLTNPWTVLSGHILAMWVASTTISANEQVRAAEVTVIEDPEGWLWVPSNNGASSCQRNYVDPNANINQRGLKLIGQGSGAQVGHMVTEAYECFMNADVAFVQEWILRTGTITDASNTRLFFVGVQNNNGGSGNRDVGFFNQNTTANWQIRVTGSSTTDTDTGVAIAANTTYRMRLEILGSNVSSATAGSFRIRGFINGTKVVDVTNANLPTADMIRPFIKSDTTATGGPYDFTIGRLRRCWNHLLTEDSL